MREKLIETLPKICTYFRQPDFANISAELEKYHKNVEKDYRAFKETQVVWAKIMEHFMHQKTVNGQIASYSTMRNATGSIPNSISA
jgi:hypothetical protein